MKKILPFVLLAFLHGIALASCNAKPNQPSQNSSHNIQEWIQAGDYDVFVHEIIIEQDVIDEKRLVYLEVEYANNRSAEELSCRRNQWYLYDNQGYSYEAESSGALYENKDLQYVGGERFLNRNMQLRGWLAFKVPENATITRAQFMTGFVGTETAEIMIDELK